MTQNKFTKLGKTFVKLHPNDYFPLRLSKESLSGHNLKGIKNIMLRKYSPLTEVFSSVLLRIFQSGICEHYGMIQTAVDFSVNPNVRTDEQDWRQIITLEIMQSIFAAMIIAFLFTNLVFALELISMTKFCINMSESVHIRHVISKPKAKRITQIIAVTCILVSIFMFITMQGYSILIANDLTFSVITRNYPMKYERFSEFLIYNQHGQECQRFINNLPMTFPFNLITGFYNLMKDDLIIVYPNETLFHIIPSNRDRSRYLWHEFTSHVNVSVALLESGKLWFVGGYRGKKFSKTLFKLFLTTEIYNMQ